ncbi:Peroxisomal membrane signal receptor PTS1 [Borealophlyctis nickersoniae]|nr:Peroxisomal membrane signal receptor PTS1 [Borealophlyctis nickersoniae]
MQSDHYNFNALGKELEAIAPPMGRVEDDWATDFARQAPGGPMAMMDGDTGMQDMERAFAQAQMGQPAHLTGWAEDFSQFVHEPTADPLHHEREAEFERAFEEAKQQASWEAEFAKGDSQNWIEEFNTQQEADINGGDVNEALSKTAGMLLDVVDHSSNPKFKSSKFMDFMKKLRDREVAVEGNKVVEQKTPFGQAGDWASEFGNSIPAGAWEEEFTGMATGGVERGPEAWADQFSAEQGGDWATEFGHALGQNWTEEFTAKEDGTIDVLGLNDDERAEMNRVYQEAFARQEQDWGAEFADSMNAKQDGEEIDWSALETEWGRATEGLAYRATDPRYDNYEFTSNNPYLSESAPFLTSPLSHRNLTESILALEAAVQRDPADAKAWYELGVRQQENENEVAAIAALRQAVKHDPTVLDAWIGLAVSYTNEGCKDDAYDALERWMGNSPRYKGIVERRLTSGEDAEMPRHAQVTGMFLEAAREGINGELDADVQTALGVLFNVSVEYDKAVDCFEAALSARPQDYLLWNKLGATLANSTNSQRAMDAYFNALEINPSYIRARYNLAISCIHLGQYREAAEHLLGALSVQTSNIEAVLEQSKGKGRADPEDHGGLQSMHSVQSRSVWAALKMVMDGHLHRRDLAEACDNHDLAAFRGEFDF